MSEFTLSQIIDALSEPFPAAYVEWKPQQVSKDGGKALAAAYVDARRYQERLDLVCPDWATKIELFDGGRVAKVSLTIAGVTREDVGEADGNDPNTVTTAVAQAFKRACAAFGLGRYLYFLPLVWCDYDQQRKKLINTPTLPDWALSPADQLAKDQLLAKEPRLATQRVSAEGFAPETEPDPVPAPQPEAQVQGDIGDFIVPESFKKHAGLKLRNIPRTSIEWYANTMDARTPPARALQAAARAFLAQYPA